MSESLEVYSQKWLCDKKNEIKESSFARYNLMLQNHIIPYFYDCNISEIDSNRVNKYVDFLRTQGNRKTGKGLSPSTISGVIQLLISIIHEYRAEYELPYKPIKVKLEKPIENIVPFSEEESSLIKNYVYIHQTPKNLGIAISLLLGLRVGEVCGLKWSSIDFNQRTLTIESTVYRVYEKDTETGEGASRVLIGAPKTENSKRVLPITRTLYELLKVGRGNNDEENYIITSSVTPSEPICLLNYFKRVLRKLDISGDYTFHSLRHTFATNCINAGMDYKSLSRILGHSSINITLDLYVHPQLSSMREQLEVMEKCL